MLFEKIKGALGVPHGEIANESDIDGQYARDKSLVDLIPWCEFLEDSKQLLFADGKSRMGGFEIDCISTDGRGQQEQMEALHGVAQVIGESLPETKLDPWVLQLCYSTEVDYEPFLENLRTYVNDSAKGTQYTEDYIARMERHLKEVHTPGGYFHDDAVTDAPWVAKKVRVRVLAYRRYWRSSPKESSEIELEDVLGKISSNLQGTGIKHRRLDGDMFYRWMRGWFNPAPAAYDGSVSKMLKAEPWAVGDDVPFGRDMAEAMFGAKPSSNDDLGFWYFDGVPHCALSLGSLKRAPLVGQLTGELDRGSGGAVFSLTDRLPEGTRMMMTITSMEQEAVSNHITTIDERAMGDTAGSRSAKKQATEVLDKQLSGDPLFPTEITFFVKGENDKDLQRKVHNVVSLVGQQGVTVFDPLKDPLSLDTYIRNIPGVYIAEKDRQVRSRAQLQFASHAAALSPVWGRTTGTGNPGIVFWNRAAELLTVDPLNLADRKANAHGFILGPTGSGKSATVLTMLDQMMAVHRPRMYIIEAGNSFGLFADHARNMGLTVNETALSMGSKVAIPPFTELYKLVDELDELRVVDVDEEESLQTDIEDFDTENAQRNRLGEAYQVVKIMITGGDADEEKRLLRPDKALIQEAIVRCAVEASKRPEGVSRTVKPSQIQETFIAMSLEDEYKPVGERLRYLGDSMKLFNSGLNRHLFERDGETWPEADITIINMAQAAMSADNADTLAVAYTSLMLQINALVERDQYDNRQTLVLTDEGHLILKNPMLAPAIISITKMWRKLGAWYWVATQNMKDFVGPTVTLLNMMEFWFMLYMTKNEVDQAAKYVEISPAQKKAMLQCEKISGKYTEGIMMSGTLGNVLFRNVPPPLALALAQTEKPEKVMRRELMEKHGLKTELEAAYMVADMMVEKRREELKRAKR